MLIEDSVERVLADPRVRDVYLGKPAPGRRAVGMMRSLRDSPPATDASSVLRGVDLDGRAPASCVGILGHNGMGKTTLLKTVMGLIPGQGRHASRLDGAEIERLPTHARARLGLGYVPQGRQIFPACRCWKTSASPPSPAGRRVGTVDEVLDEFPELTRLLDRPGGALSGGEQQLLALARALCGQPRLLLLDEPTEGIQPSIVEAMIERIGALRRRPASPCCWSSRTWTSSTRCPTASC